MTTISKDRFDQDAIFIVERLRRNDHQAFVVGGCVRDLLLGRKPKDFDVATSATPQDLRRLFRRNCRIIGRRFRLAHIFFGAKVIETSTFRANPREPDPEEEAPQAPTEAVRDDLLIRRDNVFGTAEEDARRRDFTINGLFYDVGTGEVIDHVGGLADLEARLVRTIGDPDVRFREDPVRILRAIKFAARCDLEIEPATYQGMMDHAAEIQKCAQARVSEEFFRLLRAGAARRSLELLRETGLLSLLAPELETALAPEVTDPDRLRYRARLWAYLSALDRATIKRDAPPSNALVLATLLLPPLRDALHPDSTGVRDLAHLVGQSIQPLLDRLKASRRDSDLSRQILLSARYVFPGSDPHRRRARFSEREFYDDVQRLVELVTEAEAIATELGARPIAADAPASADTGREEALLRELETPSAFERSRRDRGRRFGRDDRDARDGREGRGGAPANGAASVASSGAGRAPAAPTGLGGAHPRGTRARDGSTPIPDLAVLGPRPTPPLPFLGTGAFGGRWSLAAD
jgi:poly(A) polymerase